MYGLKPYGGKNQSEGGGNGIQPGKSPSRTIAIEKANRRVLPLACGVKLDQ